VSQYFNLYFLIYIYWRDNGTTKSSLVRHRGEKIGGFFQSQYSKILPSSLLTWLWEFRRNKLRVLYMWRTIKRKSQYFNLKIICIKFKYLKIILTFINLRLNYNFNKRPGVSRMMSSISKISNWKKKNCRFVKFHPPSNAELEKENSENESGRDRFGKWEGSYRALSVLTWLQIDLKFRHNEKISSMSCPYWLDFTGDTKWERDQEIEFSRA